ncbi:uncharacterized protein LOC129598164 [Paramacrobiotus metropolitanus]|uniref:uncharacterized protein LOC129598164 n=1 Tax=Paramacrobiotus metropolitanus TaxID=2943436 RepID=UPI002445C3DD|nr:uncharacterized protein LOC129598164 [Paramacrobiotus metropolitanus]
MSNAWRWWRSRISSLSSTSWIIPSSSRRISPPTEYVAKRVRNSKRISLGKPLALAAGKSHVVGKGHENAVLRVPTNNFAVGKYTFDVLAEGLDSADWDIRVESCWATYTDNADDPLRYDLIHRGCFFDLSTELEFLFTATHFGYRYAFTPFRFRGQSTGAAFVHCRVGLCQASAADFGACMGRNLDPFCRLPTDLRKITRQVPGRISVLSGPSNRTVPAAVRRPKRSLPEADAVSAALHAPLQPASLWIV